MDTQSDRISRAWGAQVVCVNYSLAPNGVSIEDGTQEIVDTVLYFRDHAAEYHIDPEQMYIMGYSAGGYHATASLRKTIRNTSRCTIRPANCPNRRAWQGKPRRQLGNG